MLALAGSRDQYWVNTSEPATSAGSSPLWIRAFMSKLKPPLQSEPPELPHFALVHGAAQFSAGRGSAAADR